MHTSHIDPLKLAGTLVARRNRASTLVAVRIYRGKPNPITQPAAAAASNGPAVVAG